MNRAMSKRFVVVTCTVLGVVAPAVSQEVEPPVPQGFQKVQQVPHVDAETEALNREWDKESARFNELLKNPKVRLGYLSALHNVCRLSFDNLKVLYLMGQFGLNFKTAQRDPEINLGKQLARQVYAPADEEEREEICSGAWQSSDYLRS